MAKIISYGKITVAAAGTPVRLTTDTARVSQLVFCSSGTTRMYIGLSGMDTTTGVGVLGELIGAAATSAVFPIQTQDGTNGLDPSLIWIDAASNDGALYAYAIER